MRFYETILPNGLEIIAECNDSAYSAALGFFVKTGSRDETPQVAGISHFLEHLVFKGTETRSAADVNRQLDEMGADSNASTSEEQTLFYATVLPELQGDFVELFADLLRPALRQEDFDMEKQVVLEEIGMYEDQPPFGIDEKCRELFYPNHPLGHNILGSIDSVGRTTVEDVREYLDVRYSSDNIVLVACGRIDFEKLVEQANRFCGHWKPSDPKNPKYRRSLSKIPGKRGSFHVEKESATLQYVLQLVDGPDEFDDDLFAADLLTCILGDEVGSRLFWKLVDPGTVESLGLSLYEFLDNGYFLTGLCCAPEVAERSMETIAGIYRKITKDGIVEDELTRAVNKTLSRLVLGNERPCNRLFSVASEWIARKKYWSIHEEIDKINRVTRNDITEVLRKYPLDNPLTLTVGPKRF